jgi:cytochrome P450
MNAAPATIYPPGPRTLRPLGYLRRFRRDSIGTMLYLARTYGDFVRFRVAGQQLYLVSHPEAIHDVLVVDSNKFVKGQGQRFLKRLLGEGLLTSEGEFHLRQRRLVSPAFHRQRLVTYSGVMVDYSAKLSDEWARLAQRPAEVDMASEMMRLTLQVVGKTLFDANVGDEANEVSEAVTTAMELFRRSTNPIGPLLERLPLPSNRRFAEARQRLDGIVLGMIQQRRASGEDRGDLLSMLLLAQDDAGRAAMTDTQVRDEAMTLFLAGHETTANLLTWTWYLLSQNPDAEARLHAELATVLGGRLPGFDDLPALPYLRMVLSESMRVYPPAYVVGRQAVVPYRLGPYTVPAGATILVSQYVVHHDPRWYPEPERFDPDRWTPEAQAGRPKFSYFPFGAGPRMCIGEQFAWTEASLVMATLAQRWQPRLVPGHPIALRPLVTLRPLYGMRMYLEPRA